MSEKLNKAGLTYAWSRIKNYVDTYIATKQDTLVSGVNVKTINSESVLGAGNISVGVLDVTVTPVSDSGIHIADIEVDGVTESLYGVDYSGDITSVSNRIGDVADDLTVLGNTVAENTTDINTQAGQIADLEIDVSDNTATITALQTSKQDQLTAGTNVQISTDKVISATDTTYTAGENIQIDTNNVISATDTTYTAGENVNIAEKVISVDLSQYYTSDKVYTKEEINALIGDGFQFIPVDILPSVGTNGSIYLLRTSDPDIRDMYVYNNSWTKVGSTGVSLSGVVKTTGTKDTYDEHTITVWESGGVCRRMKILGIGWETINTIATNDGYGTNSVGAETGGSKI